VALTAKSSNKKYGLDGIEFWLRAKWKRISNSKWACDRIGSGGARNLINQFNQILTYSQYLKTCVKKVIFLIKCLTIKHFALKVLHPCKSESNPLIITKTK